MSEAEASSPSSRVHWKPHELQQLAEKTARILFAEPGVRVLAAIRRAQDQVIAVERRREIKAWSIIEPKIGALLAKAQSDLLAGASHTSEQGVAAAVAVEESSAPEAGSVARLDSGTNTDLDAVINGAGSTAKAVDLPGAGVSDSPVVEAAGGHQGHALQSPDAGRMGAVLAVSVESALLVALSSRAVEDALTKVFARAFKRAIDERESGASSQTDTGPKTDQRVLLAGFPVQMAKGLEDALRGRFDVRRWTPNQGAQMLETLTRMCSIAVIPEEADDEMGEALRGRDLQVVRHDGSPARLAERLSTMAS